MSNRFVASSIAVMLMTAASPAVGQDRGEPTSGATAQDLVSRMTMHKLEAFAVPDPASPDRFVAALLIPGSQLLVVSAQTTAPAYVQDQIAKKQYREAYATLNSAAVLPTKLFIQDMGCDGLIGKDDDVNVMYEHGTDQTIFDGDWKRQKLSKNAYEARLTKADAAYRQMLALLTRGAQELPADLK